MIFLLSFIEVYLSAEVEFFCPLDKVLKYEVSDLCFMVSKVTSTSPYHDIFQLKSFLARLDDPEHRRCCIVQDKTWFCTVSSFFFSCP